MPGPLKDYWNEFDWERELKKDDARISTYMSELPRYIDLPSEDAVIMKHIQERPELVPFGGDYHDSSLAGLFDSNTDYEEDVAFGEDWQKRDGSEFYIVLGRLAKLWAQYFALLSGRDETVAGMRILALYGKMMARSADIIDMDEDEYPALRIAIVKRLLADGNLLLGEFRRFGLQFPRSAARTEFHFEHLMLLREKMLNLLMKYRSPEKGT